MDWVEATQTFVTDGLLYAAVQRGVFDEEGCLDPIEASQHLFAVLCCSSSLCLHRGSSWVGLQSVGRAVGMR